MAQSEKGLRIYGGKSLNTILFVAIDESETSKAAIKVYPAISVSTNPKEMLPIFKNSLKNSPDLLIDQTSLKENIILYKQDFFSFLGTHSAQLVFHINIENDLLKIEKIVTQGSFHPNFSIDTFLKRLE
jgi:hypothetical protein